MITKEEVINLITSKLPSSQVFVENLKGNDHLQVTVIAFASNSNCKWIQWIIIS